MKKLLNIITDGKYQKFKTIFIITICSYLAFFVVMTAFLINTNFYAVMNVYILINICLGLALIIEIFYYLLKVLPLKKSIKLATIDGSLEHISEIIGKDFESNGRIAFSNHFFYDLKTNFFITYESIVWVYYKDSGIIIRTINGQKFTTRIDNDNLGALLKANPQIMNGYSSNNYKDYISIVSAFKSHTLFNAETIVFDIPNAINNFWQWLSSKVKSKVFYTIGYTCEALFFIGLIVIANVDSPGNRISNLVFALWIPLIFIALICLGIGYKIEGYEPKTYKIPQMKQFKPKTKKLLFQKLKHTLSSANWKTFLTEEKSEIVKKKCKFCKKEFPESEINENGYCPHCAEHWWKT